MSTRVSAAQLKAALRGAWRGAPSPKCRWAPRGATLWSHMAPHGRHIHGGAWRTVHQQKWVTAGELVAIFGEAYAKSIIEEARARGQIRTRECSPCKTLRLYPLRTVTDTKERTVTCTDTRRVERLPQE